MKYGCMREVKLDYWQKTKGSELPFAVRRAVAHTKKPKLLCHKYTAGKIKSQIIKDIFLQPHFFDQSPTTYLAGVVSSALVAMRLANRSA